MTNIRLYLVEKNGGRYIAHEQRSLHESPR